MASNIENAQALILDAIKQKNPSIRAGEKFDWLIVSSKLRHAVTTEEFIAAMRAFGDAGLIGADETRRHFVLTETGVEALAVERLAEVA
jgi:hypothetical protein